MLSMAQLVALDFIQSQQKDAFMAQGLAYTYRLLHFTQLCFY